MPEGVVPAELACSLDALETKTGEFNLQLMRTRVYLDLAIYRAVIRAKPRLKATLCRFSNVVSRHRSCP